MFFSVIVPTYNPKKYLPELLSSISRNECVDEIEVIISDDCSTEDFNDVILSFPRLHLSFISNQQHEGFPRTGRQNGAKAAVGKWICFADQDDYYIDNAFDKIKQYIGDNDVTNYLITDFVKHREGTEEYIVEDGTKGWTHGKFYEKAFWDKYDLGYDNVQYCEDVNLSTKTGCILVEEGISANVCHDPIYIWNQREGSLSQNDYFAKSMDDYIRGSVGVIVDHIAKFQYNTDVVEKLSMKFLQTLFHIYFYSQSDALYSDKRNILQIATTLLPIYERFMSLTNLTTKDVVDKAHGLYRDLFAETRHDDYNQVPFVEHITFEDWMFVYMN